MKDSGKPKANGQTVHARHLSAELNEGMKALANLRSDEQRAFVRQERVPQNN